MAARGQGRVNCVMEVECSHFLIDLLINVYFYIPYYCYLNQVIISLRMRIP